MQDRDTFGSKFGVLVAMAGSAVGLGNLWRFPYLVGTNGGAAFIFIYLAFVFLLCLPLMYSEFVIGRRSRANVFGAFKVLAPKSNWSIVGIIAVLASISIMAFYSVVGGWTVDYFFKALTFQFSTADRNHLDVIFNTTVTSTYKPLVFMAIFVVLTALIVIAGVKKGIEKYTKIMMPLLFLMIILLDIRALTLPGASAGVSFLFKPDFSKVTSDTLLDALGQAFFSLSLGCGTIITYASYVSKNVGIVDTSIKTAVSDTLFAILAGIAIMPAVFAFGISPSEGPGLVFITLPYIFVQIPLGSILAILFFFILFIAAITSSISLMEVAVAYLIEEFKMKRLSAVLLSSAVVLVLGTLCSLSQGLLSGIKIAGRNFFDLFDFLSSNVFMTIGGLLSIIFVGWWLKKEAFKDEMHYKSKNLFCRRYIDVTFFVIKYIAPIVVFVIMLRGWLK